MTGPDSPGEAIGELADRLPGGEWVSLPEYDVQMRKWPDSLSHASEPVSEELDLNEVRPWLRLCGSCDAGLPMGCTCPSADPRPMILRLVQEIERLRAGRLG